jgi:hypothetical protein
MIGIALKLLGFRMVQSPEAIRVTTPKVFPGVMDEMREKVIRDTNGELEVRVVRRSVIARIR